MDHERELHDLDDDQRDDGTRTPAPMSDLTNAGDSFHTNAMLDNILVAPDASCVGYRHPSAFVEAFRRSFGTTPKAWIVSLEKLNGVS